MSSELDFWATVYDWYLRTEHPWDFWLVFDAIVEGGPEYQREFARELLPILAGVRLQTLAAMR